MNWKKVGQVLFFIGLGIFVFNQIQSAVFANYYGVWYSNQDMTIGLKIFEWVNNFKHSINGVPLGWPGLMVAGLTFWVGARKANLH